MLKHLNSGTIMGQIKQRAEKCQALNGHLGLKFMNRTITSRFLNSLFNKSYVTA